MALIAVLRSSSRSMASMLDFWMKNKIKSREAKIATIMSSRTVKPFLLFIKYIIAYYGICILSGFYWAFCFFDRFRR